MDNVFYRWEQDFTCIILRLEVFGALPRYEEIQKINVIMPVMDHVYKVLEALIDIQRAVLRMKYHTSDQYPLEKFNFLVHDGLLQYYEKVWHHYQKALKISYPQTPYVNHPQDRASPVQQNRTTHIVRAQDENESTPPHLQSNPQYTHPPQQYHQEHFQNIHENIVQEENHPPNHEGLGSLVTFQQRNHNQALSGPITHILSPAGTKSLLPQTIHELRNVQENSIQQSDTSVQIKPRVIKYNKYYTSPSYPERFQPEAKDLHTPTHLYNYSQQRHKIRKHHAEEENDFSESTARENYVRPSTDNITAQHELLPLQLSYNEAKDGFRLKGLVGATVT